MVESFVARRRAAPLGTAPPAITAPGIDVGLDEVARRCRTTMPATMPGDVVR
jgi:hypothetical protein